MRTPIIALALLFILSACAPKCQPAPEPKALSNSPLQQYRLSGVILDTEEAKTKAKLMGEVPGFDKNLGARLTDLSTLIKDSFRQPGQPGYDALPAVRVMCVARVLRTGMTSVFTTVPARFAAKLSLVDPATDTVLFSKEYTKAKEAAASDQSFTCIPNSIEVGAFQDAANEALSEFGKDVQGLVKPTQPVQGAAVDGTLSRVDAKLEFNEYNIKTMVHNVRYGGMTIDEMYLLASITLPNVIQKNIFKKRLMSNSPSNTYNISTKLTKFDYYQPGIFSGGEISFTAETTLSKNGKDVRSFTYSTGKIPLANRSEGYEKFADAVARFIVENAAAPQP